MKKEDKIITFTKYIMLQFYHITCFTCFYYCHISLACYKFTITQNFMANQAVSKELFRTFGCVTFLSFLLFVFKAKYLLQKVAINPEFSQSQFYIILSYQFYIILFI